jgi:hypothetical protein
MSSQKPDLTRAHIILKFDMSWTGKTCLDEDEQVLVWTPAITFQDPVIAVEELFDVWHEQAGNTFTQKKDSLRIGPAFEYLKRYLRTHYSTATWYYPGKRGIVLPSSWGEMVLTLQNAQIRAYAPGEYGKTSGFCPFDSLLIPGALQSDLGLGTGIATFTMTEEGYLDI